MILKEKICSVCLGEHKGLYEHLDGYGCWDITSKTISLDNDCERCIHTYKEDGCKLLHAENHYIVIGICPTHRRKNT